MLVLCVITTCAIMMMMGLIQMGLREANNCLGLHGCLVVIANINWAESESEPSVLGLTALADILHSHLRISVCQDRCHPYLLADQSPLSRAVGHLIKAIKPAVLNDSMMAALMYLAFNAHSDVRPAWDLITSCQHGGWHRVTAYPPYPPSYLSHTPHIPAL